MPDFGSTGDDATAFLGPASASAPVSASASVSTSGEMDGQWGAPAQLGRYLVIEELGRGGMGVVLRAYDPVLEREVALKRLRGRAIGPVAKTRMVREARAMARLSHPNVVAVYDVETDEGSVTDVVVVMEYVRGRTLYAWLNEEKRSCAAILDAFVAAGRGLAAAHAEGLLHRDFKLDNVLVGTDGRVRVTDFGLARVTGARASEEAMAFASNGESSGNDRDDSVPLTEVGTVVGTPAYMPPEQLFGDELDARVDQYAFCVALWRALTGRWPFDARSPEHVSQKRAGAPAWPSDVAVPRHIVDAIRRGLACAPSDRFATLGELLTELCRHTQPRARAWIAIGVLAIAGLGAWGWDRAARARIGTLCAEEGDRITDAWNDARADAIATAFEATAVGYAAETWDRSRARLDAFAADWRSARIEICERAELKQTLPPELAATARACLDEQGDELAALLDELSQPDETVIQHAASASASLPIVRSCTDVSRLGPRADASDPKVRDEIARLRRQLSKSWAARATGQYEDARAHAQSVLGGAKAIAWVPLVAEAMLALGDAHDDLGRYEDSQAAAQEAFFAATSAGRDDIALRASTLLVHVVGHQLARYDEGLHWGRIAWSFVQRLGQSDDPLVAALLVNLGSVYYRNGELDRALEHHRRALALRESTLGAEHPQVASSLNNLGLVYYGRGEDELAVEHIQRALTMWERTVGTEHPLVAASLNNLGFAYDRLRDHDRAIACQRRALAVAEKALGPEHPTVAASLHNLAGVHHGLGQYDRALELYERARAIWEKSLGPDHPDLARSLYTIASVWHAKDDLEHALPLYERALAIREAQLGPDHPDIAQSLDALSEVRRDQGAVTEAVALAERALAIRERTPTSATELAWTRFMLARGLWDAGTDRVRAKGLAIAAADEYRTRGPAWTETLTRITDWLATTDASP